MENRLKSSVLKYFGFYTIINMVTTKDQTVSPTFYKAAVLFYDNKSADSLARYPPCHVAWCDVWCWRQDPVADISKVQLDLFKRQHKVWLSQNTKKNKLWKKKLGKNKT